MLNAVILTRGALEVADELRPYFEADGDEPIDADAVTGDRLEFAILLEEVALARSNAA